MNKSDIEKKKLERFLRLKTNASRDSYIKSIHLDGYQPAIKTTINDGWNNVFSGQGIKGYDPDVSTYFSFNDLLDRNELTAIWCGDGIGTRIVKLISSSMIREGFTVDGDTENLFYNKYMDIGGNLAFLKASRWASLYGGAVIIPMIDDGQSLESPINYNNIKRIVSLSVYDRWQANIFTNDYEKDKYSSNFGKPNFYTITPIGGSSFRVHYSRVIRFDGEDCPDLIRYLNLGWGISDLQNVYERLRGLGSSFGNIEKIIKEFIVSVISIEGLSGLIADPEGEQQITDRLEILRKAKHILNAMLIDKEESFSRISATTTGLPELMNTLIEGVCAGKGIPVSLLMGRSPGGLNSTGKSEERFWYDEVSQLQSERIHSQTVQLCKLISLCKDFKNPLSNDNVSVKFNPLWQLSEKETAEIRKINSETSKNEIESGVLASEEVAQSRYGGDSYSNEIQLLYKDRSDIAPEVKPTNNNEPTNAEVDL